MRSSKRASAATMDHEVVMLAQLILGVDRGFGQGYDNAVRRRVEQRHVRFEYRRHANCGDLIARADCQFDG